MNNLKKLAVATAVSTAIGVGGVAQANTLFFPFLSTVDGAYTFLTVVNDAISLDGLENSHDVQDLHFYYGYKPANSAATDACLHRDYVLSVTDNAILNLEVAGKVDLIAEFGDVPSYGIGFIPLPTGQQGFASVELNNNVPLFGDAVVINASTGLHTAYAGIASTATNDPDWSAIGNPEFVTSWYPVDVAQTSWYALALGLRSEMTPNAGGGEFVAIRPQTDIDGNWGAFYRDGRGNNELYVSGTSVKAVTCWGTFDLDDMLGDATPVANGGWMSVAGYASTATTTSQPFALWKIQSTSALGTSVNLISAEAPRTVTP